LSADQPISLGVGQF